MTGDKFNPAEYRTDKPWNPTATPWAQWPTAKDPETGQPSRRTRLYAALVCGGLIVLSFWWLPAAGILGCGLAIAFMVGG